MLLCSFSSVQELKNGTVLEHALKAPRTCAGSFWLGGLLPPLSGVTRALCSNCTSNCAGNPLHVIPAGLPHGTACARAILKLFSASRELEMLSFSFGYGSVLLDLPVQFQKEVWLHEAPHNYVHSRSCAQLGTLWGFPKCAFIPSCSLHVQMLPGRSLAPNIRENILSFRITKCYSSPCLMPVWGFLSSKQSRTLPASFLPLPPPSFVCSRCWLDSPFQAPSCAAWMLTPAPFPVSSVLKGNAFIQASLNWTSHQVFCLKKNQPTGIKNLKNQVTAPPKSPPSQTLISHGFIFWDTPM